jgi:hypothetical protein
MPRKVRDLIRDLKLPVSLKGAEREAIGISSTPKCASP